MEAQEKLFSNNNVLRKYGQTTELQYEEAFVRRFGKRYLDYRDAWEGTSRSSLAQFPTHLDFELGDLCNQACIMCPRNSTTHKNTEYDLNTKQRLSLEIFNKVIQEAADHKLASINLGAFAEPLIHSDMLRFVSLASQAGVIDIRVITNGILLARYADKILDSAITNLFISVDASTAATYEKIRGNGFQDVIDSIEYFIKERNRAHLRFPFVRVSFVEMNINRHEKADFLEQWSGIADFVDIQPGEDLSHKPDLKQGVKKRFSCVAPWQRMSILANGDVLPCCNFYGRYLPIGNVLKQSLIEIWNSTEMSKVRSDLVSDLSPACSTCQSSSLLIS